MTTSLLALLLAPAGLAVLVAAALWRRRQQRRLLNSRETAHLLRQAHYLLQLGHTVLQCDIDPDIARALLGLAEETLDHLAATGQPEAETDIEQARQRSIELARAIHAGEPVDAAQGELDHARIRLQLTDASRLLHRALRRGLIDRSRHQHMVERMEQARLQADIDHLLLRQASAAAAGDHAHARACLSQARGQLLHKAETPWIQQLLEDIDQRLLELDRGGRSVTRLPSSTLVKPDRTGADPSQ